MKISPKQAVIIERMLSSALLKDDCQVRSLEDQSGEKVYQGIAQSVDGSISVVFSLPTKEQAIVFALLTDGCESLAQRIVATLDDWSNNQKLAIGNVQEIEDSDLNEKGLSAIILLPTDVSDLLEHFTVDIHDSAMKFSTALVVLLTKNEYSRWKEIGHDGLMEYLEEENKDIVLS